MLKRYLRKKQYEKIKSYIKFYISVYQRLADNIADDEGNMEAKMIKECRIAQKITLMDVLHFIENEEKK